MLGGGGKHIVMSRNSRCHAAYALTIVGCLGAGVTFEPSHRCHRPQPLVQQKAAAATSL